MEIETEAKYRDASDTAGRRAGEKDAREAEKESGRGDQEKGASGVSEAIEIRSPDCTTDVFSVWDKCAIKRAVDDSY